MRYFFQKTITFTFFSVTALSTNAELLMQWKRLPLSVDLHVGEERIIFVDKNVQVGIPSELDGKLSVQSTGGAVYLKASDSFDLSRLQLRDIETAEVILIDLKSRKAKGALEPIRITYDQNISNNKKTVAQTDVSDPEDEAEQSKVMLPIPAALTRYAAQSLYAPLRTVEPLPGVRRIALKLPKSLPTLLPNLVTLNTPLESWMLDNYVVTAVRIKNLENRQIPLDPRYLQGYFYAATFQHNWLGEKGTPEDTTVVYLVTEGRPTNAFIPNIIRHVKTKSTVKNTKK